MPATPAHSPAPSPPGILTYRLPEIQAGYSRSDGAVAQPVYTAMPLPFLFIARRLAELYHLVFPERPEWLDEEVGWVEDEDVAQATEQFLRRVAQHRFPVDTDVIDVDAEACEWTLWRVPVAPLGFAIDNVEEWEEFQEPARLFIKLTYGECLVHDHITEEYPQLHIPAGFDTAGLGSLLREMTLDGPLTALPDLLNMVRQETDNPWLDFSHESLIEAGSSLEWEEDFNWLAADWVNAKPVVDRVLALLDWVEEDMATRLKLVVETLLVAYARRQALGEDDAERPR